MGCSGHRATSRQPALPQEDPLVTIRRTTLVVIIGLLSMACSSADRAADPSADNTTAPPGAGSATWSYAGDIGPDRWGSLSDEYAACSTGTEQSPIDLTGPIEADVTDIVFAYGETPLAIYNNGHTIEVEVEGSSIEVPGGAYDVVQFHFHAGSEHAIDGSMFPLEMHIVHRSSAGELAVVGVMVEVGEENEALTPVFDHIPTGVSERAETIEGETVDLAAVLPAVRTFYQYQGSLTTPPCSEGVAWYILATPIEISQEQLDEFTRVVDGNVRPVQPLGDREIIKDIAEGP
jgi:carbonic anhydrase